jgi:hypothetical protein
MDTAERIRLMDCRKAELTCPTLRRAERVEGPAIMVGTPSAVHRDRYIMIGTTW